MTPDEKAIIDAKREAFMAGWKEARPLTTYHETLAKELAEKAYPYPPHDGRWREAVAPSELRYRRRDGVWECASGSRGWSPAGGMSDEYALALARCVTEPTLSAEEVARG